MKKLVSPRFLLKTIRIPCSKSEAQRAILISALLKGKSIINNVDLSDDVKVAIALARNFGAEDHFTNHTLDIYGKRFPHTTKWNCGESGFCLRVALSLSGLFSETITISGTGTILKRDFSDSINQLSKLKLQSNRKKFPIKISGNFEIINNDFIANNTSQFASGILIAATASGYQGELEFSGLKSRKYLEMTMQMLNKFGAKIYCEENYFYFKKSKLSPQEISVSGDWSNASFFLVAGAINGDVRIKGLDIDSLQPDKKIVKILKKCGANFSIEDSSICVKKSELKSFSADCTHSPDLFPPLLALAVNCLGTSRIKGVHRLFNKESNRAANLVNEYAKLGCKIYIENDDIVVWGGSYQGGEVCSHNDHRLAMSLAIAGLNAKSIIKIDSAEAVNKSFPKFWDFFSD